MSVVYVILAVCLYPALVILSPEPVASKWGARNKVGSSMPPEVWAMADRNGRYVLLLDLVLLFASGAFLSQRYGQIAPSIINFTMSRIRTTTMSLLAGLGLGLARYKIGSWLSARRPPQIQPGFLRGSAKVWIGLFIFGGFAEELWRAFCIRALQNLNWGTSLAILVTSAAFGIAYMAGLPSRVSEGWANLLLVSAWGAALGLLFVASGSVLIPCIANIISNITDMIGRRRITSSPRAART